MKKIWLLVLSLLSCQILNAEEYINGVPSTQILINQMNVITQNTAGLSNQLVAVSNMVDIATNKLATNDLRVAQLPNLNQISNVWVDASGNVGVGVTAPDYRLHTKATENVLKVEATGGDQNYSAMELKSPNADWFVGVNRSDIAGNVSNFFIQKISGTARVPLVIDNAGNVGIGTTNPVDILHISGLSPSITLQSTNQGTTVSPIDRKIKWRAYNGTEVGSINLNDSLQNVYNADMIFSQMYDDTVVRESMRLKNGNVGIGTNAPTNQLVVATTGTSGAVQQFVNGAASGTDGARYDMVLGKASDDNGSGIRAYVQTGQAYDWQVLELYNSWYTGKRLPRLTILPSGNIGIGTNAPTSLLSFPSAAHIGVGTTDGSDVGYLSIGGAGVNGTPRGGTIELWGNESPLAPGQIRIVAGDATSGDINFYVNGSATPQLCVDQSTGGRIGVNTTNPVARLDVSGHAFLGAAISEPTNVLTLNVHGNAYPHFYNPYLIGNAGGLALGGSATMEGVPTTPTMFWNVNSGNVGVGTTNPVATFHVASGGSTVSRLSASVADQVSRMEVVNSIDHIIQLSQFGGNYPGDIGGVLTGDLSWMEASGSNLLISTTSAGSAPIKFAPSRVVAMTILSGGNVGIGMTNPTHLVTLNGGAYCDGTGDWIAGSDLKYKKDILSIPISTYGLSTVLKLNPVSYVHKQDTNSITQIGFIAQEVKPLVPEVVAGTNGGYGIAYARFAPVFVNAIKELNAKLDEEIKARKLLEERVRKLEMK